MADVDPPTGNPPAAKAAAAPDDAALIVGHAWVDSHCHLDPAGDVGAVVAEARAAGVTRMVNVGTDVASSRAAIEVAASHDAVWATAGVHPHDASGGIDGLEELLDAPKVVAVGECGLDYHYDHSPRIDQRRVFAAQIALAHKHHLPLVIHTREAWDDTFDVLAAEGVPDVVVMHCFTGGPDEARRSLDVGAYLSFSGIVTFPSAPEVRAAAALCPADRILVETDSPYLAPAPNRGRANRPAWVGLVGAVVAEVRTLPVADLADLTRRNAIEAFGLGGGEAH
jgi:TatD DNase family protein